MDEATKQILKNQKSIMCFLRFGGEILRDNLGRRTDETRELLNPPSLAESKALNDERDDLMGNTSNEFLQIGGDCKLCGTLNVCGKMLVHHRLGKCLFQEEVEP